MKAVLSLSLLGALLVQGCRDDKRQSWPRIIANMSYDNGHPLVDTVSFDSAKEFELATLLNVWRSNRGLYALDWNDVLADIARANSSHMLSHFYYDHVNPEGYGPTERVWKVAPNVPVVVHENIWKVGPNQSMADIITTFENSPLHARAMESVSSIVGIGLKRGIGVEGVEMIYVTMMLVELW